MEKLCVFCVYLEFDYDLDDGSCPTCGSYPEFEMGCKKGYWKEDIEFSLKTYREKILTAKKCADYEVAE